MTTKIQYHTDNEGNDAYFWVSIENDYLELVQVLLNDIRDRNLFTHFNTPLTRVLLGEISEAYAGTELINANIYKEMTEFDDYMYGDESEKETCKLPTLEFKELLEDWWKHYTAHLRARGEAIPE